MDNPGLVASLVIQAIPIVGDAYSGLAGVRAASAPRWRSSS
jgi:hypothetical protein